MDLEKRVERLENRIGVTDATAPLVLIKVMDQQKNSQDQGSVRLGVIPGRSCGHHGQTLTRDTGESESSFLERCETRYSEIYT